MSLEQGCTLITGGAVRLGRALSLALSRRNTPLAVHYHSSAAEAESLLARLRTEPQRTDPESVRIFQADFSRPEESLSLLDRVEGELGPVTSLILSAASYPRDLVGRIDLAGMEQTLRVNLTAPFLLAQEAGVRMKSRGRGSIVGLLDWSLDRPYADRIPYTMAKAGFRSGLLGLARALAPEVRVNGVAPGAVLPPEDMTEEALNRIRAAAVLQKIGSPEDAVQAVLYLLEAEFVTGTVLTVDGGRSLR